MHALVLGAGVVGVTTAYYLSQLGWRVTVIDRESEAGRGTSFANASQLSYSFTDALARPGFVPTIPSLLLGRSLGTRVRPAPGLFGWGTRFLAQCTSTRARHNTLSVLRMAARSAELMANLRSRVPIEFAHRKAGKLVLLSTEKALDAARRNRELKLAHGCRTEILGRNAALELEPALRHVTEDFRAAVWSSEDAVADSHAFTVGLRRWLEQNGQVEFRLGSTVSDLVVRDGAVQAVTVDNEELGADAYVVCLGAWSDRLLGRAGVRTNIFPVRGYSLTLPPGQHAPQVSVTSLRHQFVISHVNGHLRVAGFADFRGFDTSADDERLQALEQLARRIAPDAGDYDAPEVQRWGGFRPMTPNGQPRVGATRLRGLFVNTGHGMLGWTLACASASDVARAMSETGEKESRT